jgi:hypothetical protein
MKKSHIVRLGRSHARLSKSCVTKAACFRNLMGKATAEDYFEDLAACFEEDAKAHAEISEMCADLAQQASDAVDDSVETNADAFGSENFEATAQTGDLDKLFSRPDSPLGIRGKATTEPRPEINWNI